MAGKSVSSEDLEYERYMEMMNRETAPGWRPTPGTTERATVIGMGMRVGGKWGDYPVITYKRADGSTFAVHAFHQVLRDRLAEIKTDIGSEQYVTYVGPMDHNTEKNDDGTPKQYNMYYAVNVTDLDKPVEGKEEGFHF